MTSTTDAKESKKEKRAFEGGCHCGAVRFRITVDEPLEGIDCNCSICTKKGAKFRHGPVWSPLIVYFGFSNRLLALAQESFTSL